MLVLMIGIGIKLIKKQQHVTSSSVNEKFKYIHQIRPDNDDHIVTKDDKIIIPREIFIPSASV